MAHTADRQIEHLLRRAGFGARPDELDAFRRDVDRPGGRRAASTTSSVADDVDSLIGKPGYVGMTITRRVLAAVEHRRRAAALAVPDGAHQPSAAGEDDALLAQPLRHRLHQDRRRARRRRRRALHGGEGVRGSGQRARPDRDAARQRARQLPRHPASTSPRTRRCWSGSTAGPTPRRSRRRTSAARSWSCSRWASATTPRPTSTPAARVFTGWNLARPGAAADGSQHYEFVYNAEPARHRPRRRSAFRSIPTAARRFRRARRPTGMQDGIDFINAPRRATRTPARYLATKLYRFFVTEFGDVNADVRRTASRRSTCRAATT